ncbi:MAG: Smr/MutS family protein [Chitinophagaceae bacterium]|nr:Smr/MutS family protein [Chitinophagaceae bacterium]MCW5904934.1 Smr/MutS family protein [Chitinophagaceae bacterium]
MKYQVGDEIIILLTNEEGKVVEILNEEMVMIEVKGVKFPAYLNQIDFPYFYRFSKKKIIEDKKPAKVYIENIPKEKPQPNQIKVADGVWLSFIPKFALDVFNDEVVESLKIYLINKTDESYQFTYTHTLKGAETFAFTNTINAHQDFYIHDIDFATINDSPAFYIDFNLCKPDKQKAEHFETSLKLKPKQFFNKIEEMKEKNEPTIAYKLFEEYPNRTFEEDTLSLHKLTSAGYKVYDVLKAKQNIQPARTVIDLHIDKITDDWKHLSNFEILSIQLKEFEKWYDIALANKQSSLTVIHGVGKGKLKSEIHEILKYKPEVKKFNDDYNAKFGYGATEIFFK